MDNGGGNGGGSFKVKHGSEHVANLTRSSYFHLRRLRAIRCSVSSHVFTSIVHAFVCPRIDYCNSLLVGLPKVRLSPIQSVLNAAARLVGRLPRRSHISPFMFDHLPWIQLIARIQLKVLTLIYHSHVGQAPRYLRDLIRLPSSPISLRPLCSLDRHDLFVRERGLIWFRHEPLQSLALRFGTNSFLLLDPLYQRVSQVPLFVLSRLLSFLWVSRTVSASDWCALQEALYKCIDTIQYNFIA